MTINLIWLFTAAIKLAYIISYQPKQLIHKFNLARWKIRKVDGTNTSAGADLGGGGLGG